MRKTLNKLLLVALAGLCLASCSDGNGVGNLENRIDEIENTRIKTISQQVESINASLPQLQQVDAELKTLIESLQAKADSLRAEAATNAGAIGDIERLVGVLEQMDSMLVDRISGLESYVRRGISDTRDWTSATFATLAQCDSLTAQVAAVSIEVDSIHGRLDGLDGTVAGLDARLRQAVSDITESITNLETSMKSWVNGQLTAYWTIEKTKAALEAQGEDFAKRLGEQKETLEQLIADKTGELDTLASKLGTCEKAIKDNAGAIAELKSGLEQDKQDIKAAYEKAIADAITECEGRMNSTVSKEITDVNERMDLVAKSVNDSLDTLRDKVTAMEKDLSALTARFDGRIQSLVHIPTYSDGVEELAFTQLGSSQKADGRIVLRFEVSPHWVAGKITKEQVKAQALYTRTRASAGDQVPLGVKSVSADASTGILTVIIDASRLSIEFNEGTLFNASLSASVRISVTDTVNNCYDITSGYVAVRLSPTSEYPPCIAYRTKDNERYDFFLQARDADGNVVSSVSNEIIGDIGHINFGETPNARYSLCFLAAGVDRDKGIYPDNNQVTEFYVSEVTTLNYVDATRLFYNWKSLREADLRWLGMHMVCDMTEMFRGCDSLTSLGISVVSKNKLRGLKGMFMDCRSLTSLDLQGWSTALVQEMTQMFSGCECLASLDLSCWDISATTTTTGMFAGCKGLRTITMRGCNDATVRTIEAELTEAGIRDAVKIVR